MQKGTKTVIRMDNTRHISDPFELITLENILSQANMLAALKRVEANKGAPGIDGMETTQLREHLFLHPGELSSAIRNGTYKPSPVKRVSIPKPERGKYRDLGIPTVIDRLVQQAITQVMSDAFDFTFSSNSFGFRPNRGAHDAIYRCVGNCDDGYCYAVDMDLSKFFDTVNHSRLIRKLDSHIKDKRVISLIHKILTAGVCIDSRVEKSEIGLPQGGPLSPLLANIYLDELDKLLEKRGHRFARYADDIVIQCRSRRAAERTLANVCKYAEGKMLLKVNREKTSVAFITQGIKFLGYGFRRDRKTKRIIPSVHQKSRTRLKDALRIVLARNLKCGLEEVKRKLKVQLSGWANYFSLAPDKSWRNRMDEWIRHRIRMILWKTWKRIRTRYRALCQAGVQEEKAWKQANTRKGYWRSTNTPIVNTALNPKFLAKHQWCWLNLMAKPLEWK